MRHCPSAQEPRLNSHSARARTYCFIWGVALLAGVNFEPLWVRFTEIMYILWCRRVVRAGDAAGPGVAGLPAAPPDTTGGWPPVVGAFCATANEAPPTSSAVTIISLFSVVIESSHMSCCADALRHLRAMVCGARRGSARCSECPRTAAHHNRFRNTTISLRAQPT
jgi:hypothetical protein